MEVSAAIAFIIDFSIALHDPWWYALKANIFINAPLEFAKIPTVTTPRAI
jgi:hypothetical protein